MFGRGECRCTTGRRVVFLGSIDVTRDDRKKASILCRFKAALLSGTDFLLDRLLEDDEQFGRYVTQRLFGRQFAEFVAARP